MSKEKRRNLALEWTPEVKVSGRDIVVTTGIFKGGTRWECKGELSIWCAAHLVKELRKAMRQIRRDQMQQMNSAIEEAEQVMS